MKIIFDILYKSYEYLKQKILKAKINNNKILKSYKD